MNKTTILCVDDEADNLDALERLFRKNYHVLRAQSGREALTILEQHQGPIALIITDQRMPEMTGVQLLEKTINTHPETLRILLTGYTDLESVIEAVNKGQIYRYLTKPWDSLDLLKTVEHATETFVIRRDLKSKTEELEKAFNELKSLDTAKSNFMILINHELKTPLTTLLSFSDLLSETKLDDEQQMMLNRIRKSADRLKTLIDDVLLIVRAETGQIRLDNNFQIIHQIDESHFSDTAKYIKEKKLTIEYQLEPQPVYCDARLIKQVLLRLVHNAVKFAREGSTIKVVSQRDLQSFRFSVFNEGSQISDTILNKIFNPFFIDENIMNHSTGLGLGLSICQAILKTHQSQLHVNNHQNGVEVSFRLFTRS